MAGLESLGDSVPFGIGPGAAAEILEEAVVDVLRALDEMRAGPVGIEHYE